VADAPRFAAIEDRVRRALDADVLVAHNAHVDVGVLQTHLGEWKCPEVLDTLKLAKRLRPNQMSYKLGTLVEAFKLAEGLPEDLTPHRATYDVLVAARLFVRLGTRDDGSALSIEELRGNPPEGGEDEPPALF
jgi:DNA polymerase III epsilon subunit-like protein